MEPERGHGERTHRDTLMDLCRERNLTVANAWFRKRDGQKVTYMAPGVGVLPAGRVWDPAHVAELDLCLTNRRWKGAVTDVRSTPFLPVGSGNRPEVKGKEAGRDAH